MLYYSPLNYPPCLFLSYNLQDTSQTCNNILAKLSKKGEQTANKMQRNIVIYILIHYLCDNSPIHVATIATKNKE